MEPATEMTTTLREKGTRTCVGCQTAQAADSPQGPQPLVRLVLGDESIVVDAAGGAFGRGVHVHPTPACLEKAARGGLARSLRTAIKITASELAELIRDAYARRATGLLVAARRQHKVAVGADASGVALDATPDAVAVVATDAAHAASLTQVQVAVKEGRAVVWLNRAELGAVFNREEVAVCVVTDRRIGDELRSVNGVRYALPATADASETDSRGAACRSREVR